MKWFYLPNTSFEMIFFGLGYNADISEFYRMKDMHAAN